MRRTISNILIIVFSAIIVISAFRLWKIFYEYHAGEKEYEETASSFVDKNEAETDNGHEESLPAECPITVDFDRLIQKNADVVGWIYSEGTQINYPVLRGEDNSVYLHNMISGEYNPSGSIFMDYRCEPDLSGFNTIIYGHHMKNGSMFASLHQYVSQEFYDEHKYLWYLTPDHIYRLDVLAGYVGDAEAEIYTIFNDKDQLQSYLSFARAQSTGLPLMISPDKRQSAGLLCSLSGSPLLPRQRAP
jgi:sortase B